MAKYNQVGGLHRIWNAALYSIAGIRASWNSRERELQVEGGWPNSGALAGAGHGHPGIGPGCSGLAEPVCGRKPWPQMPASPESPSKFVLRLPGP